MLITMEITAELSDMSGSSQRVFTMVPRSLGNKEVLLAWILFATVSISNMACQARCLLAQNLLYHKLSAIANTSEAVTCMNV